MLVAETDVLTGETIYREETPEEEAARLARQPTLDDLKNLAINEIKNLARAQYELWQSAYAGSGDWLAVLQAVENALIATRQQAIAEVQVVADVAAIEAIMAALAWPPVPGQAEIEADVGDSLTAKAEVRQFLTDFPNARLLIDLPYADLITAIQNRTAGQETLLLMTLAFAVRYLKQLIR